MENFIDKIRVALIFLNDRISELEKEIKELKRENKYTIQDKEN